MDRLSGGAGISLGMSPFVIRSGLALLAASTCLGAEPRAVRLWPGSAPGETGAVGEEHDTTTPSDNLIAGRPVIRTGNVSTPTVSVYPAPADKNTGAAVLVCPGGGYNILAMDLEGTEVCEWLNSIGVTAALLKYRVPKREGQPAYAAPLEDAQRAMSLFRLHARDWGVDPMRIGVLGFSAGAHLSAALSASTSRTYPRVDEADDVSSLPNFQLLIYPGGLVKEGEGYTLAPEVAVTSATPPTFLVMAEDDPGHVENILAYAIALKAERVPMEMHLYPTGGHGYGLRATRDYVTSWPLRAADWMRSRGLLEHN
jgi:acetyl esterase/lipase